MKSTNNSSKKRRLQQDHSKSVADVESSLEEFLFGKDIISNINNLQENEVEAFIDRRPTPQLSAAWEDDDDEELTIDFNSQDRLKKLKKEKSKSNYTGVEMTDLLKERFQVRPLDWASASNIRNTDLDASDDVGGLSILQQSGRILNPTSSFMAAGGRLRAGQIEMARVVNANIDSPSSKTISAVRFHPTSPLLMVSSFDKTLKFFSIDGETNPKKLSVSFVDFPISAASYLGQRSQQAILSARKSYYYVYDIESGQIQRIPGITGKTLKNYENITVSPEGSKYAIRGDGGYTHICSSQQKAWMFDCKMNCAVTAVSFLDETVLATSGTDAEVYLWDLRKTGRCLEKFRHDDGSATSSLSGWGSKYLAVGAESGVVTVFDATTKISSLTAPRSDSGRGSSMSPIKSVMSLTTKATSSCFHPSGQILAIASDEKIDRFKLVHIPSCTVFSNWPTDRTPMRRVKCMEFSSSGEFLAIGNNKGRVLLYRLNQFAASP